ncbi:hypothetical protein FRC12_018713 [Ceratobasidium sp. 428]|nr:hypothetical protein FRC12_018713 [Ceratobasidium sp. 428]
MDTSDDSDTDTSSIYSRSSNASLTSGDFDALAQTPQGLSVDNVEQGSGVNDVTEHSTTSNPEVFL